MLAQCEAFFDFSRLTALPLVPLHEVIGVLGWTRWREIEEKNTLAIVRDSVEALIAADMLKTNNAGLVSSVIHATLTDAAITAGRSGNSDKVRAEAIDLGLNAFAPTPLLSLLISSPSQHRFEPHPILRSQ